MDTIVKDVVRQRFQIAVICAMARSVAAEPVWGVDDCALWCAQPIIDVLGYDPASEFRGRYRSSMGAGRVLAPVGGLLGALMAAAARHGWRQIDPAAAQAGDIGLGILPNEKRRLAQTTFVCRAPGWFVARSNDGFVALQPPSLARAWAVI